MAFVYTGVTFCSRWCAYLVAKWFGVGGVCVAMGHAVVSGVVFVGATCVRVGCVCIGHAISSVALSHTSIEYKQPKHTHTHTQTQHSNVHTRIRTHTHTHCSGTV